MLPNLVETGSPASRLLSGETIVAGELLVSRESLIARNAIDAMPPKATIKEIERKKTDL